MDYNQYYKELMKYILREYDNDDIYSNEFNNWLKGIEKEINKEIKSTQKFSANVSENELKLLKDLHYDTFGPYLFLLEKTINTPFIQGNAVVPINTFINLLNTSIQNDLDFFFSRHKMNQSEINFFFNVINNTFNNPNNLIFPVYQDISFTIIKEEEWNGKGSLFFPIKSVGDRIIYSDYEERFEIFTDDILDKLSASIVINLLDRKTMEKVYQIAFPDNVKICSIFKLTYAVAKVKSNELLDINDIIAEMSSRFEEIVFEHIIERNSKNKKINIEVLDNKLTENCVNTNAIYYNVNTGKFSGKVVTFS